jgi:hypothetical protein
MIWRGKAVVVVVCLAAATWVSATLTLAQDSRTGGANSTGLDLNSSPRFHAWRTVTLGIHKGVDAYRNALDAAKIKIGDAADEILGRPAFPYVTSKTEVQLALVSAPELGVDIQSKLSDIYRLAKRFGLTLCPGEVGPQLRLDYRDQPVGEVIDIAMEPVATYYGDPTILSLMNFGQGLALIGGDGRSDVIVTRTKRFIFALPAGQGLEAERSVAVRNP